MSQLIQPKILTIQEIFAKSDLQLPDYQRPYKWASRHILQLLNDLSYHFQHQGLTYRLGTLVLHQNGEKENIVDGQQRLTSLALILEVLEHKTDFLQQEFNHSISQQNISQNYQLIQQYFSDKIQLKSTDFKSYILNKCELVCVTLNDLDEAFQFFDSQNARGKSLEPYDLLKAYHLREIPAQDPKLLTYVENWEAAVYADPSLKVIISQTLYRLRQWQRDQRGEWFETKDLAIFKGIKEGKNFPYLIAQQAGMAMYQLKQNHSLLYADVFAQPPFQIHQTLINGSWFFEYIQYYRQCYQQLFDSQIGHLAKIKIQDKPVLEWLNYTGNYRTGDRYIRQLFECTTLFYYDKFGTDGLETAIKRVLHWAYQLRLKYSRIYWGRIEQTIQDKHTSLLHCIHLAQEPDDIARFIVKRLDQLKYKVPALMQVLNYRDEIK